MREPTRRKLIWCVLLLALLVRLPGLFWGTSHRDWFQPDETQHVEITYNFVNRIDPGVAPEEGITEQWNARAFGVQAGLLAWPLLRFGWHEAALYGAGRTVSLLYGLAAVVLTIWLTDRISGSPQAGIYAGLALAVFDLHVTYSHTGVPVAAHTFWAYAGIALAYLYQAGPLTPKREWGALVGLAVACAMGLATRFNVVLPLVAMPAVLIASYTSGSRRRTTLAAVVLGLATPAAFFVATGFEYGLQDARESWKVLLEHNQNVVEQDNHLLLNPLLYAAAIVAGASLPAVWVALGAFRTRVWRHPLMTLMLLMVGLSLGLFWVGDATFVRRATVFMPCLAILTGIGAARLRESQLRARTALLGVAFAYTLGLTLVSQSQFVFETRYQAAGYLRETHGDEKITYTQYALSNAMPPGIPLGQGALGSVLVLHETGYGRYSDAYLTTPFGPPECCTEVYHCNLYECLMTQQLLYGESDYVLDARFAAPEVFLERILFKHFFGTYETMLGDVLVFVKR